MIGLVLAAGAGRRLGRPKASVTVDGERLVDRAVRVFHEAGVAEVVVVLGAEPLDVHGARVVMNDAWSSGMASSLRRGLSECGRSKAQAACVLLVDLPDVGPDVIRLVAEDAAEALTVAYYDGRPGHPVVLGRHHWSAIAAEAQGDSGARAYLQRHAHIVRAVEVGHLATGSDLDLPEGPWLSAREATRRDALPAHHAVPDPD